MFVLPILLALAACGGGGDKAAAPPAPTSASPTASPTPTSGPVAFITEAQSMTLGNTPLSAATEQSLLNLGNLACTGLGEGLSFGQVVQTFVETESEPTAAEAEAFARLSVTHLCPQHTVAQ